MGLDGNLIFDVVIIMILVGINAFFASSEIAIISLSDNKIKKMAEEGNKKAKLISDLTNEPSKFFATIQVGVTLSGLLASAFAADSFASRLTILVKSFGVPIQEATLRIVSLIVVTIILSYITLVFGELIPKKLAVIKSELISMIVIRPLSILLKFTRPFVSLLTFSTNSIIKLFGINPHSNDEKVTEEEIRMMVDLGEEKGVILDTEREMIENIFEFNDITVSEVMTHRKDIIGLPINSVLEDAVKLAMDEGYTRIPIYEDSIDNILGILNVKDLLKFISNNDNSQFDLRTMMWEPYYVLENTKIDDLFKKLQKNNIHMAIVIDEYGGTDGIVTIEDLLEEIVGNIFDEYDEIEKEVEKIDDNTYIMKGSLHLHIVEKILDLKLPLDDYETLSGFIVSQLGRIPDEDEKPTIEYEGVVFKVEKVEQKRIEDVKVCRT